MQTLKLLRREMVSYELLILESLTATSSTGFHVQGCQCRRHLSYVTRYAVKVCAREVTPFYSRP